MSKILAPLRHDLDAMPSPDPETPGLVLRDRFGYSERVLVVPPQLVRALSFFDGRGTEDELREFLVRSLGRFDVSEQLRDLVDTLEESGFLDNEQFQVLRDAKHGEFAKAEVRQAAFAGMAYPECPEDCRRFFDSFFEEAPELPPAPGGRAIGIAAPHASFEGGPECYREAFGALRAMGPAEEMKKKTFILLATSHYGDPERFGVTQKPYMTPYGQTTPANEILEELRQKASGALVEEDYCHTMEHSAEFHVLWLQHLFGPEVKVLPILVGAYAKSIYVDQQPPEATAEVAAFFGALRDIERKYGDELVWVLSIDMAHMGPRYGDEEEFAPGSAGYESLLVKDAMRLEALQSGDAQRFWSDVLYQKDPLKWCGSACLYTLLNVFPGMKTEALNYGQWNIDEASMVSFGALRFSDPPRIVLS